MAKGSTTNLAEQNAERAMYAANHGMDWMREIAERSLNQSRTMFEEFLTTGRTTVDIIDRQASEVRERSMSLAAETISNTFDFAHKIIRMREPQELIQLQTEFISRQAPPQSNTANQQSNTGNPSQREEEFYGQGFNNKSR